MTNKNSLERGVGEWFVSSYSGDYGTCVQVKFAGPGAILVRDSKDRRNDSPVIAIPSRGWSFLPRDVATS